MEQTEQLVRVLGPWLGMIATLVIAIWSFFTTKVYPAQLKLREEERAEQLRREAQLIDIITKNVTVSNDMVHSVSELSCSIRTLKEELERSCTAVDLRLQEQHKSLVEELRRK